MNTLVHIIRRTWQRFREARRRARFAASVQHLHGPSTLEGAPGEVVLIAVVRNASYYLDGFFRHYRAMGVRHFVFIDNGSTDDTVARIAREKGTVMDRCTLPLADYADLIRPYPARTYGQDRWCLYVDVDELLDFAGRTTVGINGLITYLEREGYTALVAQTLDMFPKSPLREGAGKPFKQVLLDYLYFDISAVRKVPYHGPENPFSALLAENTVDHADVAFCFGGVRGKVLGENTCLTKHPLIFNGPGVTPAPHPHLSTGVTCADMTAVIKRYGLAHDPGAQMPDITLFSLDARRWNRVELLYRAGFLTASDKYTAYLETAQN